MGAKPSKEIPPIKVYFPQEDVNEIKEHVEKIIKSGMLTLHTYNF
jgi:predicted nucleic acid-binding protein